MGARLEAGVPPFGTIASAPPQMAKKSDNRIQIGNHAGDALSFRSRFTPLTDCGSVRDALT
jgi:hypothetical protein